MSRELNFAGDGVHEIAALRLDGSLVAGCFDRLDAAESAIAALGGSYKAVWSTLNRAATLCAGRTLNPARLTGGPRVKNSHIEPCYISLLFDYDPPRARGTMSTNAEYEAALTQAQNDREWFHSSLGWPRVSICGSGSGAHLRPFVNLEATPENTRLVARVLAALKQRSSFIDVGRYALNQLCRYYGTWNRKSAENDPLRPWRMSTVLDPGDSTLVTREQLMDLCDVIGVPEIKLAGDGIARPEAQEKFVRRFSAYCERIGVTIDAVRQLGDGTVLIQTEFCLLNEDHTSSSCGVGVGRDGVRKNLCRHNGCAMPWSQWSRAVEQKFRQPMRLDGEITWKR
jgi:hypothetical protein